MPRRDGMQIATQRNRPPHGWKMPWIGSGYPVRTPGKEKQASSVAGYGNQPRPKKPASSLLQAASPAEYGVHRSPPAADRCSGLDDVDTQRAPCHLRGSLPRSLCIPGDRPASCLDVHRPTRGHRHVRNWARREIGRMGVICKKNFRPGRNFSALQKVKIRVAGKGVTPGALDRFVAGGGRSPILACFRREGPRLRACSAPARCHCLSVQS